MTRGPAAWRRPQDRAGRRSVSDFANSVKQARFEAWRAQSEAAYQLSVRARLARRSAMHTCR
jgi:hypothetical protein